MASSIAPPTCAFRRLSFLGCGSEGLSVLRSQADWTRYRAYRHCGAVPELPAGFDFDKESIVVVSACESAGKRSLIHDAREVNGNLRVEILDQSAGVPMSQEKVCQSDAVAVCATKAPLQEIRTVKNLP
jgi:hypothetical protein